MDKHIHLIIASYVLLYLGGGVACLFITGLWPVGMLMILVGISVIYHYVKGMKEGKDVS